jgi:hypothetical protein
MCRGEALPSTLKRVAVVDLHGLLVLLVAIFVAIGWEVFSANRIEMNESGGLLLLRETS